jgi:hypothetical protein
MRHISKYQLSGIKDNRLQGLLETGLLLVGLKTQNPRTNGDEGKINKLPSLTFANKIKICRADNPTCNC